MKRSRWLALVALSLAPMLLTLLVFPLFPQEIPLGGAWKTKYAQLALPTVLLAAGPVGLLLHRVFSAKGWETHARFLERTLLYFLSVGLVLHIVLTLSTYWNITLSAFSSMQDQPFDLMQVIFLIINILAMVVGNKLPRRPFGDPLAIRARCAEQDREIWRKTQSLAGPLYVFAGILGLILCVFLEGWTLAWWCLFLLLLPAVTAVVYSHRLWNVKYK